MNPQTEGVDEQLDRLNTALQYMIKDITEGSNHIRDPSISRVSIAPSDFWNEKSFSEQSESFDLKEEYENKIEELLQEQDRLQMTVEDFHATEFKRMIKIDYTDQEIGHLIELIEKAKSGQNTDFNLGAYRFFLAKCGESISATFLARQTDAERIAKLEKEIEEMKRTDSSSALSTSQEGEEICTACGVDSVRLKKEIKIELEQEYKKRKNEAIERERANFEAQLEELDSLKDSYLQKNKEVQVLSKSLERRKAELEKKEFELANRKSTFEKKKHEWETRMVTSVNEFQAPSSDELFSPSKFSKEELEIQLKELKDQYLENNDSKLAMRINQMETQLTKYRTEKAILDSNVRNSRVLSSLVKTFDNETSQEENKRKKLLERLHKRYQGGSKDRTKYEEIKRTEELTRQMLEKKHEVLLHKEKELQEMEKYLQDSWKKVPNASNLVEVIQVAVEHLNQNKVENEININKIEQDKLNLRKVHEKLLELIDKIESQKNSKEVLEKIKENLSASLQLVIN